MAATVVVRVLPDVPAVDRTFDYLVPEHLATEVEVGTMVRVELAGRRVGGWVVAAGVEPPPGVALRQVAKVTGLGPSPEIMELARWAAWRWAGRPAHFLRTASPPRAVAGLPEVERPGGGPTPSPRGHEMARGALARGERVVVRLPPDGDVWPVVLGAAAWGPTLVVAPSHAEAGRLGGQARRAGLATAVAPVEWPRA
ncbi:MAG: hypothetical protein ACRDZ9_07835, partial [Acidimicrobiales bacterium]